MKYLALLLIFGFGLSAFGQTIKTLGYNSINGQVVANTGTNVLTFTNLVSAQALTVAIGTNQYIYADDSVAEFFVPIAMESSQGISFTTNAAATTRANLGFSINLNTLWTATNASDARSAVGLGRTDNVVFAEGVTNNVGIGLGSTNTGLASGGGALQGGVGIVQDGNVVVRFGNTDGVRVYRQIKFNSGSAETRTNLGLGATWLTNTNVINFRSEVGLGETNTVTFQKLLLNGTQSASFPLSIGQRQTQATNEKFYGFSWDGQYNGDLTYHHDVVGISSEPEVRVSSTAITIYSPITFASGSSAQTRTNLGLGGGITTNRTFVSYNGTNYTTNTVTISNGIITGWTQ